MYKDSKIAENSNLSQILYNSSMMCLYMICKIAFLSKTNPTNGTDVRFFIRMRLSVSGDFVFNSEALPADVARVGFLSRVSPHVMSQLLSSAELLTARSTLMGEVVRVGATMDVDGVGSREGFAASVANVRPFSGVRSSVVVTSSFVGKTAATNVARVVLDFVVDTSQMSRQVWMGAVLSSAHVTRERTFVSVNPHVPHEPSLR